ncbi:DUF3951 domain-containing protein [Bacillus pseudomycoides]|uniref:DUF3951 domain-containing protein n=1 Tax=Bacillus pseudomycoides TaxID=64104 RepID=A0A2A8GVA7_9BACI|nr:MULTISPECIES: DUF3951 domain-containing protein [Bacillus]EEM06020.1 hypothetical protein bmyco0002_14770 [Bacillus pseudomycoides]EEM11820.1 hypothetical protein bmyco0003_14310 [Bacillus pseudomycoides]KFN14785.1 hypothetical protein DJ94_3733 [Bacillus pseudomycoides]MBD5797917.1 DUF3951 domain-containing protein [Bacillus pseudomycoides]MBJ8028706.1 DUF3951 domain-containing protein [Bacillus cereus group sp. N21]
MILLTIGAILFIVFIFFIIGLLTFTMLVNKATPQIYYTPCDSMTIQSHKKNRGKRS